MCEKPKMELAIILLLSFYVRKMVEREREEKGNEKGKGVKTSWESGGVAGCEVEGVGNSHYFKVVPGGFIRMVY